MSSLNEELAAMRMIKRALIPKVTAKGTIGCCSNGSLNRFIRIRRCSVSWTWSKLEVCPNMRVVFTP